MDPTSSTTPILRIQSATAYAAGGQQRPPFAQGQLLRGIISAQQGPQQFSIDINGQQVAAESSTPLHVGQKLDLLVMSLTPRVELQIVSHDPVNQRIGHAIYLIGQQAALFPELSSLVEASRQLPQLSTNSQETLQFFAASVAGNLPADTAQTLPLNGSQLAEMVSRLGMAMEHQLAENKGGDAIRTLKHALLELSQQAAVTDKSASQAEQLVKTIELFQLLQIRLANEALFFLPLPLAFLNQGYLLVERDRSGGTGKEDQSGKGAASAQKYTLHLQLEGLGNLRITIQENENRVALQFQTEDVERAKFLSNFRDELEQKLTAVTLESVHFLAGSKEPVASLLEKIVRGTTGMVDTKA
jgi:hypothetical protein